MNMSSGDISGNKYKEIAVALPFPTEYLEKLVIKLL
jgi:hypothetical protein